METFLEVLKWIGIALAVGFVGYFGRYPARLLLDWVTGRKKKPPVKILSEGVSDGRLDDLKSRRKLEKKQAKQSVKMAKKMDKT
jgi:hypothetical protein